MKKKFPDLPSDLYEQMTITYDKRVIYGTEPNM